MSKINQGFVRLDLLPTKGDEPETLYLKPSLGAIKAISNHFGSIQDAMNRVFARNFAAIVYIVGQGLQVSGKQARDLEDRVYRTGVANELPASCIEYLGVLQRGGRPLDDTADDEAADEGNG